MSVVTIVTHSVSVELHCMKNHIDVSALDFLPFHFLLVSIVSEHVVLCDVSHMTMPAGRCGVSEIHGRVDGTAGRGAPHQTGVSLS
jgi:hypothetical protein